VTPAQKQISWLVLNSSDEVIARIEDLEWEMVRAACHGLPVRAVTWAQASDAQRKAGALLPAQTIPYPQMGRMTAGGGL
jgi:hypothetical protein